MVNVNDSIVVSIMSRIQKALSLDEVNRISDEINFLTWEDPVLLLTVNTSICIARLNIRISALELANQEGSL